MQSVKRLSVMLFTIAQRNQIILHEKSYYSILSLYKNKPVITQIQAHNITTGNACYSLKTKNKGGKDKKHKTKVELKPTELSEAIDYEKMKNQFDSCITDMKAEIAEHLTLRNVAGSLEQLKVKNNSKEYELQEIADIVRKNPKNVVLNMDAFPHLIPSVSKAILQSGMNLNPQQDGTALIIPIPKITTEYREGLAKKAKTLFSKYNRKIATIDAEFAKIAKKNPNKLSDDFIHNVTIQISQISAKYQSEIKELYDKKNLELLGK